MTTSVNQAQPASATGLARFREKVLGYLQRKHKTLLNLALELGYADSTSLSKKLRGTYRSYRFTEVELHQLVLALAKMGAIYEQNQAHQLLELVECADFEPHQWQTPPLSQLKASKPNQQISSQQAPELPTPPQLTTQKIKSNLPLALTSFIGRQTEITQIKTLLATNRLLTLVGTGGVGKTRLALEVAGQLVADFKDGVWLVELAPLTEPNFVLSTVAATLGVKETGSNSLKGDLINYLKTRQLLLVLDNCEHLVSACVELVAELLLACPEVSVLATSREGLNLTGEVLWWVPTLSRPDTRFLPQLEELSQYEAIELFVARAQAVQPGFTLNTNNAVAVAKICQQLDAIPLALELAAGQVKGLAVQQIADRLGQRFRLLAGGNRAALPRQQTLRALIDWSYDLLTEPEKTLLERLAVFAGSWSLEAAEAVCADPPSASATVEGESVVVHEYEVIELLLQLVNKSLVQVAAEPNQQGENRYYLLETIRHYARDKLNPNQQAPVFEKKHCLYFCQFSSILGAKKENPEILNRAETEHDNLRKALSWALNQATIQLQAVANSEDEENSPAKLALKMAANLGHFWQLRGYISEGRSWLKQALALTETPSLARHPARVVVLSQAAFLALRQGEVEVARPLLEEGLEQAQFQGDKRLIMEVLHLFSAYWKALGWKTGDAECFIQSKFFEEQSLALARQQNMPTHVAVFLSNLTRLAIDLGDYAQAKILAEESLATSRKIGVGNERVLGDSLMAMAAVANVEQNYLQAKAYLEEGLALHKKVGFKLAMALCLSDLARVQFRFGDYSQANLAAQESLSILEELGHRHFLALCLETLTFIKAVNQETNPQKLVQLFGAVDGLLKTEANTPFAACDRLEAKEILAGLTRRLGETAFEQAWATGQTLTLAQVVELARSL